MDALVVGPGSLNPPPGTLAEAMDCDLNFITYSEEPWFSGSGTDEEYYYEGDSAHSSSPSHNGESWMKTIVNVNDQETLSFYWKVSSQQNSDYLEFYIDDVLKDW